MKHIMIVIRCIIWITLGAILLGLMFLSNRLCGEPPAPPKIVGWNGDTLLYEDSRGGTLERGDDGHFFRVDK